ncbi:MULTISPECIES: homoserine dehydrogenase [unclassified Mucilaginibacter]|uniref:homoserine dehydrogenase n=1 Tax=unclassified Mucilaginibacter TaxID=2617802 RepID=UPI002AC90D61|nr:MULTISPECIES: homoserine dehydrogenase [unclassified Mucilaginibacter]MEB0261840.1 homoserine dehydrogenase [Mucilaginibacter sp. 10I4]MEB0278939.1 homoserine dehydrogenase [Mucilaginibacter sp. 10B2]MEB0302516.1 homoserine dehydrogenase [Mucilaginibacter sp. 5C4]WPX22120.1 homoserine dehydrogenase [Mucilaginibacter sp. 5C4]
MSKKLNIGLFGFGVVGQGLYDIIKTKDLNIEIVKIAIKNPSKERSLPKELFTTDRDEILNNPEINTVVELINDTEAAFEIVSRALSTGKNVVSASKKMIATYLNELIELQQIHGTSLLYEGAVCGSIPIIRNLEEYYDNELLHSISGIFNGSSNYILSKGYLENLDYDTALKQAQDLGFAETDPTMDVGGYDAKYKLIIAAAHAYGVVINPEDVLNIGIQNLSPNDLQYAREKKLKIKLVPVAKELDDKHVTLFVLPKFVNETEFLYNVEYEYNGVTVQAAFADQQFFFGKGAGGHPTGSAVLSDIAALRYDYQYEYKKAKGVNNLQFTNNVEVNIYLRYEDEGLVEALEFEHIHERFYSGSYKFVIGKINLQKLIDNQQRIADTKAFVAFADQLTGITLAAEKLQVAEA